MPRKSSIIPLEQFKEHAAKACGGLRDTAYSIGITVTTISKWMKDNPEYRRALDDASAIAALTGEVANITLGPKLNTAAGPPIAVPAPPLEDFIEAADENRGVMYRIAVSFGVHRTTVTKWVNANPEFKEAIKAAKEAVLDRIESVVMQLAERGDKDAYKLYLKSIGKSRGYVERQEILTATVDYTPEEIDGLNSLDDRL